MRRVPLENLILNLSKGERILSYQEEFLERESEYKYEQMIECFNSRVVMIQNALDTLNTLQKL